MPSKSITDCKNGNIPSWGSSQQLGVFLTPAMVFSTVKMICEAVTPELRKVATPCVMMLCLSLVKGNTAEPNICMSKVRVAVCPAQHDTVDHWWKTSRLQGAGVQVPNTVAAMNCSQLPATASYLERQLAALLSRLQIIHWSPWWTPCCAAEND